MLGCSWRGRGLAGWWLGVAASRSNTDVARQRQPRGDLGHRTRLQKTAADRPAVSMSSPLGSPTPPAIFPIVGVFFPPFPHLATACRRWTLATGRPSGLVAAGAAVSPLPPHPAWHVAACRTTGWNVEARASSVCRKQRKMFTLTLELQPQVWQESFLSCTHVCAL